LAHYGFDTIVVSFASSSIIIPRQKASTPTAHHQPVTLSVAQPPIRPLETHHLLSRNHFGSLPSHNVAVYLDPFALLHSVADLITSSSRRVFLCRCYADTDLAPIAVRYAHRCRV